MIKIGIIGSGFGLYGLLPAFNSIENCEVVCICGKKTDRLIGYCQSINLKNIYEDWEDMLDSENLDAVAIAVKPSAQYKIAKVAIKKGIHIFAEKPLASNLKEAEELLFLSNKNEIITAVDFIFPEIDEWKKAKELIDEKKYGELKKISVSWRFLSYDIKNKIKSWKTDTKEGGGALSFYVSHVLYYLENFAGKIKDVDSSLIYSEKSMNGGEVGVNLKLKFENNIKGRLDFSCNDSETNNHKIIFECEKASIILENNRDVTDSFSLIIQTGKTSKRINVKKDKILNKKEDERVFLVRRLAKRFIDGCIMHKQVKPSFVDGVRVQELISIIRQS